MTDADGCLQIVSKSCASSATLLPSKEIHLDRVVDDEISRADGIDFHRIRAEQLDHVAHGRKIHQSGHACEILQDDSGRFEGDLDPVGIALVLVPVVHILDVFLRHVEPVAVADYRL